MTAPGAALPIIGTDIRLPVGKMREHTPTGGTNQNPSSVKMLLEGAERRPGCSTKSGAPALVFNRVNDTKSRKLLRESVVQAIVSKNNAWSH